MLDEEKPGGEVAAPDVPDTTVCPSGFVVATVPGFVSVVDNGDWEGDWTGPGELLEGVFRFVELASVDLLITLEPSELTCGPGGGAMVDAPGAVNVVDTGRELGG